jgi:RNA polymerase sigma-70 factor (ECF subfamily)
MQWESGVVMDMIMYQEEVKILSSRERTNEAWIQALRDPASDQAVADLRATLRRGLRIALAERWPDALDISHDDLVEESMTSIMNSLDSFRGQSNFTTWAQKIAVKVALAELRRQLWRNVSKERLVARFEHNESPSSISLKSPISAERRGLRKNIMKRLNHILHETVTEQQRQALLAVAAGMPLQEVAGRMRIDPETLYKQLHEARLRLKNTLTSDGVSPGEVQEL